MSFAAPAPNHGYKLSWEQSDLLQRVPFPLLILAFSLLYYLAAKLGIATSLPPEGIVVLWPPNAIILVTLLRVHRSRWWLIFLATVATEIAADIPDYPLPAAVGYGIVNFSEAALAASLLRALGREILPISRVSEFLVFLIIGPLFASGTAAVYGAAIYKMGAPNIDFLHYWRVFWFGNGLGLLILGTSLLTFRGLPRFPRPLNWRLAAEGVVAAAGLIGVGIWAFFSEAGISRIYVMFPFLLWAALRFGAYGASAAVLTIVGLSVGSAVTAVGPFAGLSTIDTVVSLQALLVTIALTTFLLAFSIEDFRRTQKELEIAKQVLEESNAQLDQIVTRRTDDLKRALAHNEMLLREVHHRIKNSLQLISSMVTLQARTGSASTLAANIRRQIEAIATSYDIIHRLENVEVIDVNCVLHELCRNASEANKDLLSLTIEAEKEVLVSAETAVGLSLAVNELITNSIKHRRRDARRASVFIRCSREGRYALLHITDDGPGFPPGFDFETSSGFGMRMVHSVLSRVGGELHQASAGGSCTVALRVPAVGEQQSRHAARA